MRPRDRCLAAVILFGLLCLPSTRGMQTAAHGAQEGASFRDFAKATDAAHTASEEKLKENFAGGATRSHEAQSFRDSAKAAEAAHTASEEKIGENSANGATPSHGAHAGESSRDSAKATEATHPTSEEKMEEIFIHDPTPSAPELGAHSSASRDQDPLQKKTIWTRIKESALHFFWKIVESLKTPPQVYRSGRGLRTVTAFFRDLHTSKKWEEMEKNSVVMKKELDQLDMPAIILQLEATRTTGKVLRPYSRVLLREWESIERFGAIDDEKGMYEMRKNLQELLYNLPAQGVRLEEKEKATQVLAVKILMAMGTFMGDPYAKPAVKELLVAFDHKPVELQPKILRYLRVAYHQMPDLRAGETVDSLQIHDFLLGLARESLEKPEERQPPEPYSQHLEHLVAALSSSFSPTETNREKIIEQGTANRDGLLGFRQIFLAAMAGERRSEEDLRRLAKLFPPSGPSTRSPEGVPLVKMEYLKRLVAAAPVYLDSKQQIEVALIRRNIGRQDLIKVLATDHNQWTKDLVNSPSKEVRDLYRKFQINLANQQLSYSELLKGAAEAISPEKCGKFSNELILFSLKTLFDQAVIHTAMDADNPSFLALLSASQAHKSQKSVDSVIRQLIDDTIVIIMHSSELHTHSKTDTIHFVKDDPPF